MTLEDPEDPEDPDREDPDREFPGKQVTVSHGSPGEVPDKVAEGTPARGPGAPSMRMAVVPGEPRAVRPRHPAPAQGTSWRMRRR